ncbi:kinetochore protein SPC24 homolog [Miscanthus floridulus]|uniref:kinetochore protein SPC24 homolog n=1 Tax=Miscanthus floridulus TaxID=154761 RepID=UPI003457FCDD
MAADMGCRLEVDNVLSFADDLMGVLRCSDDADANAQVTAAARLLRTACRSESDHLELQLKDYQQKLCSCKEKTDKANAETIAAYELSVLQNRIEENLQEEKQLREELRATHDDLENLDHQRASIEERKDAIKKKDKDMRKATYKLSMCVSVTNMFPNLEDQDKISSYTIDKNEKKIQKFEFEKTTPPVEICNMLWKTI